MVDEWVVQETHVTCPLSNNFVNVLAFYGVCLLFRLQLGVPRISSLHRGNLQLFWRFLWFQHHIFLLETMSLNYVFFKDRICPWGEFWFMFHLFLEVADVFPVFLSLLLLSNLGLHFELLFWGFSFLVRVEVSTTALVFFLCFPASSNGKSCVLCCDVLQWSGQSCFTSQKIFCLRIWVGLETLPTWWQTALILRSNWFVTGLTKNLKKK